MFAIHWFRRDLRVFGNTALRKSYAATQGKVLGLFCFDSEFLKREDFSHVRFAFFLKTLQALRSELKAQGGDLLVVDAQPEKAFAQIFDYLKSQGLQLPTMVSWNKDYEPYARARDQRMREFFKSHSIEVITERDHLLLEPHEVKREEGPEGYYRVYTPYFKKWFSMLERDGVQERLASLKGLEQYATQLAQGKIKKSFTMQWSEMGSALPFDDALDEFIAMNSKHVNIKIPEAGFLAAYHELKNFEKNIQKYEKDRDYPALSGTSKLSIYFKNGSFVPALVIAYLQLHKKPSQFLKEIAWREFYYSILFHCPEVEREAFLKQYRNLKWENSEEWFERWKSGTTGFPIVDAGMRQLANTGWMHNRVRMIVASFLTKDLLIDWRWGENYFMKTLLDGDLAPNNGGWQWAASTGCDPQPYFRIFNPWLQGKRFDPEGEYIRKFVPELKSVPAEDLHDESADRSKDGYPAPIVEHALQKEKALALFKNSRHS